MVSKSTERNINMVFQVLNRLKWAGKLSQAELVIVHRGAPGDRKTIPGSQIEEVKKSYFSVGSKVIPNHRILEVRVKGRIVWKRMDKRMRLC
jgi:uncharacterized protein (UPF0248 family)